MCQQLLDRPKRRCRQRVRRTKLRPRHLLTTQDQRPPTRSTPTHEYDAARQSVEVYNICFVTLGKRCACYWSVIAVGLELCAPADGTNICQKLMQALSSCLFEIATHGAVAFLPHLHRDLRPLCSSNPKDSKLCAVVDDNCHAGVITSSATRALSF